MARIAGVDLPRKKRIEIGLTYIYGIGRTSSQKIPDAINPKHILKRLEDNFSKQVALATKTKPIEGTKLFGLIIRCLFQEANERSIVYI